MEYILTEDEKGMMVSTIKDHQKKANEEINNIMVAIARYRKLDPNAMWTLELEQGKLVAPEAAGNESKE